ncbi:MAG TPA: hypothetical protein V6D09_21100 [Leptolyngbyaceae cyanobacterium]
MANEFNRIQANDDSRSLTELELLEALLAPDDAIYPWNPADLESEAYFSEQEQQFLLEDCLDAEIASGSDAFFSRLEKIWAETIPASEPINVTSVADAVDLQATLQQRFATYIPQSWLAAIARQAYDVLSGQKSIADQLVQCVQELLPNWAEDDLLILARPFAVAMRCPDTAIESQLSHVSCQNWANVSEIEQVRASLAIARYALAQLQNSK